MGVSWDGYKRELVCPKCHAKLPIHQDGMAHRRTCFYWIKPAEKTPEPPPLSVNDVLIGIAIIVVFVIAGTLVAGYFIYHAFYGY